MLYTVGSSVMEHLNYTTFHTFKLGELEKVKYGIFKCLILPNIMTELLLLHMMGGYDGTAEVTVR
jgi:hypothetical protein